MIWVPHFGTWVAICVGWGYGLGTGVGGCWGCDRALMPCDRVVGVSFALRAIVARRELSLSNSSSSSSVSELVERV